MTEDQKQEIRRNWVAPAGSELEKELLERWGEQPGLSTQDRALIQEWIDKPDGFAKRNALFWEAAKRSVLGHPVYETAKARHRRLSPRAWLVAWAIAQGKTREEIKALIGKDGVRTVAYAIEEIKEQIAPDPSSVTHAQIARWFFGL